MNKRTNHKENESVSDSDTSSTTSASDHDNKAVESETTEHLPHKLKQVVHPEKSKKKAYNPKKFKGAYQYKTKFDKKWLDKHPECKGTGI